MDRTHTLELLRKHKPTRGERFGVQCYLENMLGGRVDLVTEKALRERLRPCVERDAIAVRP